MKEGEAGFKELDNGREVWKVGGGGEDRLSPLLGQQDRSVKKERVERRGRTAAKSELALPFVWRMTRTTSRARTEVVLVNQERKGKKRREKEKKGKVMEECDGKNGSKRVSVSA